MEKKITIYHNPRCSKSRMAVQYLEENGKEFEIVEYLKENPTKEQLEAVIAKLGIKAEDLIRKGDEDYRTNFKGKNLSDDEWIDAMLQFPKLIERPIVIKKDKAVIARPTDRIKELF